MPSASLPCPFAPSNYPASSELRLKFLSTPLHEASSRHPSPRWSLSTPSFIIDFRVSLVTFYTHWFCIPLEAGATVYTSLCSILANRYVHCTAPSTEGLFRVSGHRAWETAEATLAGIEPQGRHSSSPECHSQGPCPFCSHRSGRSAMHPKGGWRTVTNNNCNGL